MRNMILRIKVFPRMTEECLFVNFSLVLDGMHIKNNFVNANALAPQGDVMSLASASLLTNRFISLYHID